MRVFASKRCQRVVRSIAAKANQPNEIRVVQIERPPENRRVATVDDVLKHSAHAGIGASCVTLRVP